jgi:hypothetical protein
MNGHAVRPDVDLMHHLSPGQTAYGALRIDGTVQSREIEVGIFDQKSTLAASPRIMSR